MKQILIAFVAATVLLALEDALARQCRNLLWSGILPLAALLSSVGLLAAGRPAAAGAVCTVVRGAQRRALESLDCRPKKAQPGCGGRKARGK